MEDHKIVEMYLSRDQQAIGETSKKFGTRLRALAYGIVDDHQTAEECESDTYLKAWNAIPPHRPYDYLYPFLARITRHISLDFCRSRNRLKRMGFLCEFSAELEQCIPAPDDTACRMDDIALGEALNSFLGALSPQQRNIFLRRYWYLDSISQIAQRFALSESKVKTTLFRSRKKLRDHLEKEGCTL